ncbi:uncharacterized protein HaLaN_24879, partial [Haematococcus lacustris]
MDAGNFVADCRLEDSDEVLQLPIVKSKLKKMLESAVKKMALLGAPVIPSSDDSLEQFLQSAGKFFGKDSTKWEQMGEPKTEVHEDGVKRYIRSTGIFSGTELHLFVEQPFYDERLPVREDRPDLNFNHRRRPMLTDEDWQQVIQDQPWTPSRRRQALTDYLHAKLEADEGELAAEGCHSFWELAINKDNHADMRTDKWAAVKRQARQEGRRAGAGQGSRWARAGLARGWHLHSICQAAAASAQPGCFGAVDNGSAMG